MCRTRLATAWAVLAAKRAEEAEDCREWYVLDALRDTIKRIEEGKLNPDMVYIAMHDQDGPHHFPYTCAGGLDLDMIGMVSRHLHILNSGE